MSILHKLNNKFDNLQGPKRFFVFIAIALVGIIPTSLPTSMGLDPWAQLIGISYMLVLIIIRMKHVHRVG